MYNDITRYLPVYAIGKMTCQLTPITKKQYIYFHDASNSISNMESRRCRR